MMNRRSLLVSSLEPLWGWGWNYGSERDRRSICGRQGLVIRLPIYINVYMIVLFDDHIFISSLINRVAL